MSGLPKDIQLAAMRALMVANHGLFDSVANAILAERKRCAEVARTYGGGFSVGRSIADKIGAGA